MDFSPPCHSACFSLSKAVHHPIGMGETNDSSDMNRGGLDKTKELSHTTVDSHLKGNPSRCCRRPLGKKKTSSYCEFSFYSWGSASREPRPCSCRWARPWTASSVFSPGSEGRGKALDAAWVQNLGPALRSHLSLGEALHLIARSVRLLICKWG